MYLIFVSVCLCMLVLPVCIMCVPGAYRGQKRVLGNPELELRMVTTHHVEVDCSP